MELRGGTSYFAYLKNLIYERSPFSNKRYCSSGSVPYQKFKHIHFHQTERHKDPWTLKNVRRRLPFFKKLNALLRLIPKFNINFTLDVYVPCLCASAHTLGLRNPTKMRWEILTSWQVADKRIIIDMFHLQIAATDKQLIPTRWKLRDIKWTLLFEAFLFNCKNTIFK